MKTFLQRFGSLVLSVLTGLDRVIFRGKLCALYSPEGMNCYLDGNKVLRKDFESGFKPGTPDRGNRELVGAMELSCQHPDGSVSPIGWISSWPEAERRAMTKRGTSGGIFLNPAYLQKKAIIVGQDLPARSRRQRHARLVCWLDS